MRFSLFRLLCGIAFPAACCSAQSIPSPVPQRHNVIIFVADGLRRGSVNAKDMPTFLKVRTSGVDFQNSHAVFPTFTTANASVIATGHGLGDTGDFSNTLLPRKPPTASAPLVPSRAASPHASAQARSYALT